VLEDAALLCALEEIMSTAEVVETDSKVVEAVEIRLKSDVGAERVVELIEI
jgi:hypothetical protein